MTGRPVTNTTDPARQFRVQLFVGAVLVAIIAVVWLAQVWRKQDWPVVTATLSDIQRVECKRACGGAKVLVYATLEFDRPASSSRTRCRVENYNIARGSEKLAVATTMQIAARPDSCDHWRIVASER